MGKLRPHKLGKRNILDLKKQMELLIKHKKIKIILRKN